MEFYPERFSLRKAVQETCSVSDPVAQKRGIHIDVAVAPEIGSDIVTNRNRSTFVQPALQRDQI